MEKEIQFHAWAVVELFGHSKIAGLCTEQNIAGTHMLRVDVPQTETQPAFTRLLSSGAIYAINPVTEEVAVSVAKQIQCAPIQPWDIRKFMEQKNTLPQPQSFEELNEDHDFPDAEMYV